MKFFESSSLSHEPLVRINEWIEEAVKLEVPLPHAMNLSTADDFGQPSSRMVLLKSISDEGMVFYTDYESHKGKILQKNSKAALNFWWAKTDKQIRIEGVCIKTSDQESDEYFQSRPRGSQISASVSLQSKEIRNYENLVKEAKDLEKRSSGSNLKRPSRWGGYKLIPNRIEFWKNEVNRLHRRELFILESNKWRKTLLSP
ncbi:MAG TPA: pyridoxamine 5'-phosphate oxidase [Gammaproteobacteria bacterium]|jgi:pyridoxamine 5'-phosphate oxidase|nr:pyridoxamine 5'-phosphate oxidase [Gammaproteobacteria bacterium]HIM22408.1 pyridoxamine 5'-phosphate oxidase [Gammaproteobacteria bacterium]